VASLSLCLSLSPSLSVSLSLWLCGQDVTERETVQASLLATNHEMVIISRAQMDLFCGYVAQPL
jgi:hypothetical protein